MVDSHCHLADEAFAGDLEDVVTRARAAGLERALCILAAGSAGERERAARVAAAWPEVRTSIGVHPHQAGEFEGRESEAAVLLRAELAADPLARAVGEIGLDYHYDLAPRATQKQVFSAQLGLACELDLPVVIHTREAEDDTLAILREHGTVRGVLHCFTGSPSLADQGLALGLHVSFSGIVAFANAAALRQIAAGVPEDRILMETDSPYLAPPPFRGRRNEPAWVVRVAETLAGIRGVAPEDLARRTAANFAVLFRP